MFLVNFFTIFGVISFIGLICGFVIIKKETKKMLPTEEEKKFLIESGVLQENVKPKKKFLLQATAKLRHDREIDKAVEERLSQQKNKDISIELEDK